MNARAVLVAVLLATFAPALARAEPAAAPAVTKAAQDLYTAGRESYRAALYGRALEEFERSSALVPSPNTRLYIARSLRELGRWGEAAEQYKETMREAGERGGRYAPTREAAEIELRDVEARLAHAPAKEPPVDAAPTSTTSVEPAPEPARRSSPEPSPVQPTTLTWVAGGLAVAGVATGAVLYGVASDRWGYLEDHCRAARDASCDDARSTGQRSETAAYVVLGVATALAAVTVVSLFTSPPKRTATTTAAPWPLAF